MRRTQARETQIVVALHSADPAEAGTQSTSEIVYTSYARVNVLRDNTTGFNAAAPGGRDYTEGQYRFPGRDWRRSGAGDVFLVRQIGRRHGGDPVARRISPTITVGNEVFLVALPERFGISGRDLLYVMTERT